MMDSITAQKLSQRLGIDRFTILREFTQIVFLNDFYAQESTRGTVFKGGTALRLCFGSNRYSEDLDFTTNLEKPELETAVTKTVKELGKIVPGVKMNEVKTLAGVSWRLTILTKMASNPMTIKLDFSQREQVINSKQTVIKTELPVVSTVLVRYLDPEEIVAEKYRALMSRNKGRDVYDMWYLLHRGVKWDVVLIGEKLKYYNEEYALEALKQKVSEWPVKDLQQDVGRFLPQKDRVVISELSGLLLAELGRIPG